MVVYWDSEAQSNAYSSKGRASKAVWRSLGVTTNLWKSLRPKRL